MKTIAITGVLGYSGRYIAAEAEQKGWRVIGLTNSGYRLPNPAGYELRPFPWIEPSALNGVDVLINTYWVRFNHQGRRHAAFSHEEAIENTKKLFSAARHSGVSRIVHTSITNPDPTSPLSYFRGKATLEQVLSETAIPHSILRPAILFGDSAAESILINNMAWCLRHLPCVATFGWGKYKIQPIHVQDFAELAVQEALTDTPHHIINATGQETYSFRSLWKLLAHAIGIYRPILPIPASCGYVAAHFLSMILRDTILTRDEITALCENRLASDTSPTGYRPLSTWVSEHSASLGLTYQSELQRRA